MIANDDPKIKKFIHQSTRATVGSQAYWVQTRRKLEDLCDQQGTSSFQSSLGHCFSSFAKQSQGRFLYLKISFKAFSASFDAFFIKIFMVKKSKNLTFHQFLAWGHPGSIFDLRAVKKLKIPFALKISFKTVAISFDLI